MTIGSQAGAVLIVVVLGVGTTSGQVPTSAAIEEANTLDEKVGHLYEARKYAEAFPLAKRALELREEALGPDHPDLAKPLDNLAELYFSTEDYAQAEPLFRRVSALQEKAFGPEHPEVATALNDQAWLYVFTKDYAQAEPLFRRALAIREKAFGPESPEVATTLNGLAIMYDNARDYAQAEPASDRTLSLGGDWKVQFGPTTFLYPRYIADPRRPTLSVTRVEASKSEITGAGKSRWDIRIGQRFGLARFFCNNDVDHGFQIDAEMGFSGQFEGDKSRDNIGWDGLYGVHLTWFGHQDVALRLGWFHDSSHIGDEFIEKTGRKRISYTREKLLGGCPR